MSHTQPCDVGIQADDPCILDAKFVTPRWGRALDMALCETHAREAITDGATVYDLASDEVHIHPETGDFAKVVTIPVSA